MEKPPPYSPESQETPHQEYTPSSNTSYQQLPPDAPQQQAGDLLKKTDYGSTGYTPQEQSSPPSSFASSSQGQGYQPQGQGYQPQGQGYQPQGQGYQPQGQGYQPQGQGYQPQGQGYQPQEQGYQFKGQGYQHQVNTQEPGGYTSQNINSTTVHVTQNPQPQIATGVPPVVNTHLILSIIACVCFSPPIGIFAILKSSEAQRRYMVGDYVGAVASARSARNLSIAAIICGLIIVIIIVTI
ncbi:putative transmembrane protein DDB_G0267530 [Dendronephthya gigantea]|uniref:putative transmembrane protein DDB_G0267530 n=1 Tax=Dendronephthya gigantea TaxID=151771 RepID=UPI001069C6DB|nr:putative transmembrane protein DDB_G0267530 [Dendronephthya gigantea]